MTRGSSPRKYAALVFNPFKKKLGFWHKRFHKKARFFRTTEGDEYCTGCRNYDQVWIAYGSDESVFSDFEHATPESIILLPGQEVVRCVYFDENFYLAGLMGELFYDEEGEIGNRDAIFGSWYNGLPESNRYHGFDTEASAYTMANHKHRGVIAELFDRHFEAKPGARSLSPEECQAISI
ncbi:MAG: hypothetical protein ISS36_00075 [Candidatus Aenigmarchaeota archaeon]|nr:hypothetical protein [Candidatus Aenigmarchaeota archaeon]